jgi:FAD/FMN-containing dehydrogenase
MGAEGTLGVLTKVNINCVNLDRNRKVLLFRSRAFNDVLRICSISRQVLSRDLAAFEYLDPMAYRVILERKSNKFSDFFNNGKEKSDRILHLLIIIYENFSTFFPR